MTAKEKIVGLKSCLNNDLITISLMKTFFCRRTQDILTNTILGKYRRYAAEDIYIILEDIYIILYKIYIYLDKCFFIIS